VAQPLDRRRHPPQLGIGRPLLGWGPDALGLVDRVAEEHHAASLLVIAGARSGRARFPSKLTLKVTLKL
jgi:hypothetical protein